MQFGILSLAAFKFKVFAFGIWSVLTAITSEGDSFDVTSQSVYYHVTSGGQ